MISDKKRLQIQSVIYGNEKEALIRAVKCLRQTVLVYQKKIGNISVKLVYGDASPSPVLAEGDIKQIRQLLDGIIEFAYKPFGFNSGTAKGHNLIACECDAEYIMVMNPDIMLEPSCLIRLFEAMEKKNVGMVEARQTPLEHAKEYDENTGETSWASTACTIFLKEAFDKVKGFDADTFFMYCDDLDFSWRLRLEGYRIIYVPNAIVYHSKSLTTEAEWKPTKAEVYYSAEAAILLAYKWSNIERVKYLLNLYKNKGGGEEVKAANEFERRQKEGRLPECIDREHQIAQFLGDEYCEMRYKIGSK